MWLSRSSGLAGPGSRPLGGLTPFSIVLLLTLIVTACGFQVRGVSNFPSGMSAVYVDAANRHSSFYTELTTRIRTSDLVLQSDRAAADTIIRVLNDETGQRPVSVSARNAPREYEVYYIVRYSVTLDGEEALAPQQLVLTRNYTWNETQVLGKAREEEVLRRALASDLVGLLVQQVSAINQAAPGSGPDGI